MNKSIFIIACLFSLNCFSQKTIYLDENNNEIEVSEFQTKWRNRELNLFRWDYFKNSNEKVAQLHQNKFNFFNVNYENLSSELNKITNKKTPADTNFIIEYVFSNDLCSSDQNANEWSKERLKKRAEFLKSVKSTINSVDSKVRYIVVFDNKLLINDYIKSIDFFFVDQSDFIKSSFLQQPAFCGSFILIKPDGNVLVSNGENRADFLLNYFEPITWNKIFSEKK
jgi:hypothetical protein